MQEFIITNLLAPMRLDRYLRILSPSLTQGLIEQSLRKGLIKLSGKKVQAGHRVSDGDIIQAASSIPIISYDKGQDFSPQTIVLADKILKEYLIEEHSDFLAIDKPAGLSSQGGSNLNISVDHALQYLNSQGHDLRLVHRLDKETSGIMLIAKNRLATTKLGEAFCSHTIKKTYLAIVSGGDIVREGKIESYLAKIHDQVIEVKQDDDRGKIAVTDYKVIKSIPGGLKLIEFSPQTGRMHQIRCHAAYSLKNPIAGDQRYGGKPATRLMLHALSIIIPPEVFGSKFVIEAPASPHFKL